MEAGIVMNRRDAFRAAAACILGSPIAADAVMKAKPAEFVWRNWSGGYGVPFVETTPTIELMGYQGEFLKEPLGFTPIGFIFNPDGTTTFVDGRKA
jgi:hypothetical protein